MFWCVGPSVMLLMLLLLSGATGQVQQQPLHSVARQWNEALLLAIRNDLARPPVHARNLFHVSAAMWDAWAAYGNGDSQSSQQQWLHQEKIVLDASQQAMMIDAMRAEAISYAAYRLLVHRFVKSPGSDVSLLNFEELLEQRLGYSSVNTSTDGNSASALGNRIALSYIAFGLQDGSNEENGYINRYYQPVNPALFPEERGNPELIDPNRWQPLGFDVFIDQSGNVLSNSIPSFQSPEWGRVKPFSLKPEDLTIRIRDGNEYWLYLDPGPPPLLSTTTAPNTTTNEDTKLYKAVFEQVVIWSGLLDPTVGGGASMIDISPFSRGNNSLGTNNGSGYSVNPITGLSYMLQVVPAGDYYRVLAEFWADGPESETPPGHWFTIANEVFDQPEFVRQIQGKGTALEDHLEWDLKLYLALGGAMHDAAIAAWGVKGWYDSPRPISVIRYMAGLGQCSDPDAPSYHPDGITLHPGSIELITLESIMPGERHEHLAGFVGKIAVFAWRGPRFINNTDTDVGGVGWILGEDWWPYQRPTFVSPPFAGYVSGHSTFSRAAARVLTDMTGSPYFPGGMAEFPTQQDEYLVFEKGPSVNITLQWAKYFDAADECSLSRIYGGIHPPADDIPGRLMGDAIGEKAVREALALFTPKALASSTPKDLAPVTPKARRRERGFLYPVSVTAAVLLIGLIFGVWWSMKRYRARDYFHSQMS